MEIRTDIVDKIKKLLALSKSNNINEAKLATLKAHELLAKYNISLESLDVQESSYEEVSYSFGTKSVSTYQARLCNLVGNHFGCLVLISKHINSQSISFLGKSYNIKSAIAVSEYLYKSYNNLFNIYAHGKPNRSELRHSYFEGFLSGVNAALIYQETENKLIVPCEREKILNDLNIKVTKTSRSVFKSSDHTSFNQGYHDGSTTCSTKKLQ